MPVRGIRGATTVADNRKEAIIAATKELLSAIAKRNKLKIEEIASITFTATEDLDADFPAAAARELGWNETPLLCSREINVPGSLPKCIRILLHVNTNKDQSQMQHVYLKEAVNLRR